MLASSMELVAVKMDKFSHSSMLRGSRWKVFDDVLFVEQADREDVVVIELKKNRANDSSSGSNCGSQSRLWSISRPPPALRHRRKTTPRRPSR